MLAQAVAVEGHMVFGMEQAQAALVVGVPDHQVVHLQVADLQTVAAAAAAVDILMAQAAAAVLVALAL